MNTYKLLLPLFHAMNLISVEIGVRPQKKQQRATRSTHTRNWFGSTVERVLPKEPNPVSQTRESSAGKKAPWSTFDVAPFTVEFTWLIRFCVLRWLSSRSHSESNPFALCVLASFPRPILAPPSSSLSNKTHMVSLACVFLPFHDGLPACLTAIHGHHHQNVPFLHTAYSWCCYTFSSAACLECVTMLLLKGSKNSPFLEFLCPSRNSLYYTSQ